MLSRFLPLWYLEVLLILWFLPVSTEFIAKFGNLSGIEMQPVFTVACSAAKIVELCEKSSGRFVAIRCAYRKDDFFAARLSGVCGQIGCHPVFNAAAQRAAAEKHTVHAIRSFDLTGQHGAYQSVIAEPVADAGDVRRHAGGGGVFCDFLCGQAQGGCVELVGPDAELCQTVISPLLRRD